MDKSRAWLRQYERYPCSLPARILSRARKPLDAEIVNIGMGGALVQARFTLESEWLRLQILLGQEKEALTIEAKIAHTRAGLDPEIQYYGMIFRSNPKNEAKLKILIDGIRSQQLYNPKIPRDYWNL